MSDFSIHPLFRFDGQTLDTAGLLEAGYSLIKEGDDWEREIGDFLLDWLSPKPYVTVQSSGSTGKPRSLRITKTAMAHSAAATVTFLGLKPGIRALLCLPARYIGGKMMMVRAMLHGFRLDLVAPSNRPLDNATGVYDFCAMVPSQFLGSLENIDRVSTVILGGAPVNQQLEEAAGILNCRVFETFGMTETVSHIALRSLNPPEPYFRVLPGIAIGTDSRGCLSVSAPGLAAGEVQTNDLVRLYPPDRFEWLGRQDHVINSGGIKLIPEEIEKKLQPLISSPYFVCGLPDEQFGQRLVLVIQEELPQPDLLERIRTLDTLSPYQVPKEILYSPEFVTTPNGKVQRGHTLARMGYVGNSGNL